jgi:signal transduction histidine kinase
MHGVEVDDVVGRPLSEFVEEASRAMLPDSIAVVKQHGHHQYESLHCRRDGSCFPVLTSVSMVREGTMAYNVKTFFDITEVKRAEAAAEHRAAELGTVIESIPAAVFIGDHHGNLRCNKRGLELIGFAELTRAPSGEFADVLAIRDAETGEPLSRGHALFGEALDGVASERDIVVRHPKTGRDIVVTSIAAPIFDDGKVIAAVSINLDITERRQIARDYARLYEESQQEVWLRENVAAMVSHDLRNPLSAITTSASLLQGSIVGRDRRYVDAILKSAHRMDLLIGDLLDVASIRAGAITIEPVPVDAAAMIAEAIDVQQAPARVKGVDLVGDLDLDGVLVACDRDRVLQVLGNLISNAIKFCSAGNTVRLRARRDRDSIEIAVEDDGPGIQPDDLRHVFEAYWSAPASQATRGTGLGLYISKGIVEAHGGQITVASTPGHGATFKFKLPLVSRVEPGDSPGA